jgi:IS1 family transposase
VANNLSRDKQVAVVSALVEGCSIRSTERMTGVNRETVGTLLVGVGNVCADLLDRTMVNLDCDRMEIDELWAFVGKKQRHVTTGDDKSRAGDTWTFVAVDAETKLVPSFLVGKRDAASTQAFIDDVAARLKNRVQISTDGLRSYIDSINKAFAETGVDYAQLHKTYEAEATGPGLYSPPKVIATEKTPVFGAPVAEFVSTSYVERMGVLRYTRLTNAFSKKLENHVAATALHFAHYNFVRRHQALRVTPAMAAGVSATRSSVDDVLNATIGGAP